MFRKPPLVDTEHGHNGIIPIFSLCLEVRLTSADVAKLMVLAFTIALVYSNICHVIKKCLCITTGIFKMARDAEHHNITITIIVLSFSYPNQQKHNNSTIKIIMINITIEQNW